jgi:hypothetical protein
MADKRLTEILRRLERSRRWELRALALQLRRKDLNNALRRYLRRLRRPEEKSRTTTR